MKKKENPIKTKKYKRKIKNNNQKNIEFWENQIKNYEKALNNNFSDDYIKVDSKTKNDLINSLQRTINNAKKDLEEAKKTNNLKRIKELTDTINFYQNSINQLNFSLKSTLIGGGIGTLAGLTYGYWDYNDEKKQARIKGIEAPNKKKILIRYLNRIRNRIRWRSFSRYNIKQISIII